MSISKLQYKIGTIIVERNGIQYERLRDTTGRFIPMNLPPRLSNCPWCSESVSVQETLSRGQLGTTIGAGLFFVECGSCGARGPCLRSAVDAGEQWNEVADGAS